ncbi:MAG: ATP-binding protein [Chloroflexota bacterium]
MTAEDLHQQLAQAQTTIRELQEELAETNRGLMALTLELEQRVDRRTAELRAAQEELQKTNSELMLLTLELENRVAERTAELQAKHAELNVMSQQLWQAAKLATMGELAASIAHELNNPLATVSLRVESLLAQAAEDDPRRRPLTIIQREVERMGELVANLLQFSRRGARQISTVSVADEIEKAVELIHYHLRNRAIQVTRQFAPDVPAILADRQQLRQLFLNLFTNASDAMPQGGALTLRVATGLPTTETVLIEIADTGGGIPADVLSKIMEPFFTTKPPGKGTGLGLPICRRIVQEHGGVLDITSIVGQGTTVRITLPVKQAANGAHLKEP